MNHNNPILMTGYVGEDSDVRQLMDVVKRMHKGWHADESKTTRSLTRELRQLDREGDKLAREAQRNARRAQSAGLVIVGRLW